MKKEYIFTLLDETITWGFTEICTRCRVESDMVCEMIDEGILDPAGTSVETWRFNAVAIKRIQVACRLHNDLRVNLPGVALALDLLDELEELRSRTKQLF
jgi:chaperone modulatory protein CbpM